MEARPLYAGRQAVQHKADGREPSRLRFCEISLKKQNMPRENDNSSGCCGVLFLSLCIGLCAAFFTHGNSFWDGASFNAITVRVTILASIVLFIFSAIRGWNGTHSPRRPWDRTPRGPTDVSIRYRTSKGEEKVFDGWSNTSGITGNHLNIKIAPDKIRVALCLDRILNQDGLKAVLNGKNSQTAKPVKYEKSTETVRYRYYGPEVERCPGCRLLFLVEKNGKFHCARCRRAFTPKDLGWRVDGKINYQNHEGVHKVFDVLWGSAKSKKGNLSVRVAPTFQRINLSHKHIQPDKALLYRNHLGEEKEFLTLGFTMKPKNAHINLWVAPTYTRIALRKDRILEEKELTHTASPDQMPGAAPETSTPEEPTDPSTRSESKEKTKTTPSRVDLIITGCGLSTYEATKVLQKTRPDLGTFDVYGLLRDFPKVVAENLSREEADILKRELEEAGCTVELD